ncbi:MAG: AI-2E family transporter [Deltaproteobacteria bacterium]|nr:AI-2E family transporter [Deltaproteobacteria bacterium]
MTPAAGPWSFLGRIWENDWVRFAVFTAAVSALVWLFVLVWPIFKFLILALFLAYLFDPVVDALERLRLSRTAAVVALIVGMIVLSVSVVVILLPTMTESVDAFVHKLPAYADAVKRWAGPMLEGRFDVALPSTTAEWYEVLKENGEMIRKIWESSAEPLRRILGQTFQGLSGFINALLSFIVVPVAWFYLLRDIDPLKEKVVDLFPPRHRGRLRAYAGEVDEVVSNFLRGQFTVCLSFWRRFIPSGCSLWPTSRWAL